MDLSAFSVKSEGAKGTLSYSAFSQVLFCFVFFFLPFFFFFKLLLLLFWTLETGRSYRKGEKRAKGLLEGRRYSPASHLPHSMQTTLERQV